MTGGERTFRILGVPGSLRQASNNCGLLRAAQELAPAGVEVEVYDISEIPLYNGDVEAAGVPAAVLAFADKIRAADAILIATPEYNWGIPGVLKNAIDWVSRGSSGNPLRHKPVAIVGAAAGLYGTVRAQLALRQVLASAIEAYTMIKPDLMVTQAGQKFDSHGNLTDEETRKQLGTLIEALVAWSHRLKQDEPA